MLKINDLAPNFTLLRDGGGEVSLSDFKGQIVVLYFYPKDDTPGCTTEACDFTTDFPKFKAEGAVILGVSPDSVKSHDKFKEKYKLDVILLSDEEKTMLESYGVWAEKSMYGKKYMGVERSTFVIDQTGKITHIWRGVKVPGHAQEVFDAVTSLKG